MNLLGSQMAKVYSESLLKPIYGNKKKKKKKQKKGK